MVRNLRYNCTHPSHILFCFVLDIYAQFYSIDVLWCVSWCLMLSHCVLWCLMMSHDVSWCFMMFHDVSCCLMVSYDVSKYLLVFLMMSHDFHVVTWSNMRFQVSHDVSWDLMMWCLLMLSHGSVIVLWYLVFHTILWLKMVSGNVMISPDVSWEI